MRTTFTGYTESAPSAQEIAAALGGKRVGTNRWMCRCPSHADKTPSLSVTERNGRVLFHDFGGCTQTDVLEALRNRGLWSEPRRDDVTPEEKKRRARERARWLRIGEEIDLWAAMLARELDQEKAAALESRNWRGLERAARLQFQITNGSKADKLEAFILALIRDPKEVRRLIDAGRADWRFSQEVALLVVDCIAEDARRPKAEQRLPHLGAGDAA